MPTETNWLPGILVVLAGVVGSLTYLFVARRDDSQTPKGPDDLDAKYQSVITELKEHVANKHLLATPEWEAEKVRLEALAVSLLKDRDGHRHEALKAESRAQAKAKAQAADTGFFARNPTLKGAFVGGAVVLFCGLLWTSLKEAISPRNDGMQATGTVPGGEGPMGNAGGHDEKLQRLLEAVKRTPDDVDVLAEASLFLISKQAFSEARPFIMRGSMIDPFHVKTRVGRAVMVAVEGDVPTALRELERLGALYPDAYPSHLYAGMLALDQNDTPRAIAAFERYLAVAPPGEAPPMLRVAIGQLKQEQQRGPTP